MLVYGCGVFLLLQWATQTSEAVARLFTPDSSVLARPSNSPTACARLSW